MVEQKVEQKIERLPINPETLRWALHAGSYGAAAFADGRDEYEGHVFKHVGNVERDLIKAKLIAEAKSRGQGNDFVVGVGIKFWDSLTQGKLVINNNSLGLWEQIL